MKSPPAGQGSDPCPVCGHREDAHVVWSADETFDGWAHCTVGKDQPPCPCWREWPRLAAGSANQLPAPESDDHDWRRVVRTVGKVLIATGLLLGGFVAYQLWGTGIEAQRAQNALEDEFEALLTSVSTSTSTSPATSTTVPPGTTPATVPETAPTTAPDTVPATAAPPAIPPTAEGDPVARLEIPDIDVDVVVVAGVSVADLRKGPGHYPDTPLPGQFGNAAIAGHRTTFGQPFHNIDDLEPGDQIITTTLAGRFVYEVTGTEIVDDSATHVVATTNPDIAELTLTSCHPKWSASQRIIVRSLLVADESAPVTYAEGAAPTVTTTVMTTVSSTTVASITSTATTIPVTTSTIASLATSTTQIGEPTTTPPTVTPSSGDAFSDGWFHDGSAIPQVALWASVVTAIAIGAHVLSRKVHNRLLGIAAGTLPFLIALYFFYQNVNRLLPPSL